MMGCVVGFWGVGALREGRGEVVFWCGWGLVDTVLGVEECCGGTPFYKFQHLLDLFSCVCVR